MLNCVGIFREKQQTWLDWLTILLSWDTIRKKLVSFGGEAAPRLNCEAEVCVCPGRHSVYVCGDVDAT